MKGIAPVLGLIALAPATALADWTLRQSGDFAATTYEQGRYELSLSCNRGRGLELALFDRTQVGEEMDGIRGLMLWFTLPDGRTDRWPVDVGSEGPALTGPVVVSDFNLDFFRHGQSFRLDAPQTGTVFLEGNMKGTGAARLAFLERCGI